ncbi:SGNH/GDSL hydrolase family protein [Mangrovicoccus ximenensis]|uniref:SGNH/GDSL hydrolase family protein n=1 Tax=Mangrovicoccus ximenensis TaxID=1911570 RepID=UPI001F40CA5D|nr:hypothetical protein [Mangrovicoccus ximenensis]
MALMTPSETLDWEVQPCDIRQDDHIPGAVTTRYGKDASDTVAYRFNSAGFRGKDYDPAARIRICVIGESNSFGTGLAEELTYGSRVADHLSEALGIPRDEVNLLNLSVGGASGDYVTRMLLKHVPALEFDLVLLYYPPPQRMEYCGGGDFERFNLSSIPHDRIDELPPPLAGYLELYNEHVGRIAMIKNILLAQGLLEHARIPYVIATEHLRPNLRGQPHLAPFLGALDDRWILRHRYFVMRLDRAADGTHGGPIGHGALAIAMLPLIAAQFDRHGEEEAVEQITEHHRRMRAADPDWIAMRRALREAKERAGR